MTIELVKLLTIQNKMDQVANPEAVRAAFERVKNLLGISEAELKKFQKKYEDEQSRLSAFDEMCKATLNWKDPCTFSAFVDEIVSVKFRKFSIFNAGLINRQCPNARYLCTQEEWAKNYGRRIKENARPIIYLNFKPVGYLYELRDTYFAPDSKFNSYTCRDDKELEEELRDIENRFNPSGKLSEYILEDLIENLKYCGIAYDDKMFAGCDYAAKIEVVNYPHDSLVLPIFTKKCHELFLELEAEYLLSVNKNAFGKREEQFSDICHELGHLFCGHLGFRSDLTKDVEEFEAESVSYIVCKRLGLEAKSASYLYGYLKNKKEIPPVNIAQILDAADEVENMFRKRTETKNKKRKYQDWWWYNHNPEVKKEIDQAVTEYKKENP